METRITQAILTFILQSSLAELHQRKREFDIASKTDDENRLLATICGSVKNQVPKPIEEIELSPKDEREDKLAEFLCNLTLARVEWIEEVKGTHWDEIGWRSSAAQLFMMAESRGISGTASFAILAASMVLQGFPVPKDINTLLWAAKRNSQQQVKELVEAEKRQKEQMKSKP